MGKINQKNLMKVYTKTSAGKTAIQNPSKKSRSLRKREFIISQDKRTKARIKTRRPTKATRKENEKMNRRRFNSKSQVALAKQGLSRSTSLARLTDPKEK